jgi:hypothetical protein
MKRLTTLLVQPESPQQGDGVPRAHYVIGATIAGH